MTNMGMTRITCRAGPAMIKWAYHNFLAKGKVIYPLTNARHCARHFMANDPVMPDPCIHIPVINMHICAAYAAKGDTDRNLASGRLGSLCLFNGESFVTAVKSR